MICNASFDVMQYAIDSYKSKGVSISYKRIACAKYETIAEEMWYIVCYMFYPHWDSLNNEDKQKIKYHYFPSHTLDKYEITEKYDDEIDRPIEESPTKQFKAIAKADSFVEVDKIIRQLFAGYRLEGFIYNDGKSPIYCDEYGQSFCRLELVRIGSRLDNSQDYASNINDKKPDELNLTSITAPQGIKLNDILISTGSTITDETGTYKLRLYVGHAAVRPIYDQFKKDNKLPMQGQQLKAYQRKAFEERLIELMAA